MQSKASRQELIARVHWHVAQEAITRMHWESGDRPHQRNCSLWARALGNTTAKGMRVFSQWNQDGVLQLIFAKVGTTNRFFAEFGFGYEGRNVTAKVMDSAGAGLNTRLLARTGWTGRYFDAVISAPEFNITQAVLTSENIGEEFSKVSIPRDVDYVSIDVDSFDLWLMRGLFESGFRPRVISSEFNSNFAANVKTTFYNRWQPWMGRKLFGASAGGVNHVAEKYGYRAVHVMHAGDIFFVRKDVLASRCDLASVPKFHRLARHLPTFDRQMRCKRDDLDKILDVELALSGHVVAARKAGIRAAYEASLSKNMYEHFCRPNSFFCDGSQEIEFNHSTGFLVDCHATGRLTRQEAESRALRGGGSTPLSTPAPGVYKYEHTSSSKPHRDSGE